MAEQNQENRTTSECPKDKVLDVNLSWPLMIVYLGYLIGIYFAQVASTKYVYDMSTQAFFLIAILAGIVVSFFIYNLGRIICANKAGYKLAVTKIIGLTFNHLGEKLNVSFNILEVFTLKMLFVPKAAFEKKDETEEETEDPLKKDPKLIFLGGLIAEGIFAVVVLVYFFVFSLRQERDLASNIGWTLLFSLLYGLITLLYHFIPLRQDSPTDMFNLLVTKTEEDKMAYNIYVINCAREYLGQDYILPEFTDYNSFYKAHTIYALYLNDLYAGKLQQAFKDVEDMKYYKKHFTDDDRYVAYLENIYLSYKSNNNGIADKLYLSLNGDDKKLVRKPSNITEYRTAILVAAFISTDKEEVLDLSNEFAKLIRKYENPSRMILKEKELFVLSYKKIQKELPDYKLPDWTESPAENTAAE